MKHENLWVIFAATSASAMIIGGAATAALAQPQTTTVVGERDTGDARTVRVTYRDLNLAAAFDARILDRRVGGAAREVCTREQLSSYQDPGFGTCVSGAWKGARPQIALAVRRATEIAATGTSSIPLVAIAIVAR